MPNYGIRYAASTTTRAFIELPIAASGASVNVLFQKVATATVQKAVDIIPATNAEITFLEDLVSSPPIVHYHPAALAN